MRVTVISPKTVPRTRVWPVSTRVRQPPSAPTTATRLSRTARRSMWSCNVSGIDWPAGSWLAAGNHWSSDDGTAEIRDDGRAAMHEGLAAGQALLVQLAVTAPTAPGSYVLQIDLVEERVTWFVDRGSIHATAEVTVRRPNSPLVCLLYTSPSPRDRTRSRMPSSA